MSKHLRTFSEKISTGHRAISSKPALRSSKPAFFRNYQEVEISMGPSEFQRLMKEVRKWKKEGGTLKAKLKGTKESVKMKAKIEKMPKLHFDREMRLPKDHPGSDSDVTLYYAITMTKAWDKTPEAIVLSGDEYVKAKTKFYDKAYDFANDHIMTPVGQFNKLEKKAFPRLHQLGLLETDSPFMTQGENYHRSVGWY